MDARAKTVSEILNAANQYLIPFFQRQYSWRRKQWLRLWQDIMALLKDDNASSQHFLGPLVCTADNPVPAEITSFQLIDGQQRLTTLTMLLAAIRDAAERHDLAPLVEQVTEQYLVHKYQKGHKRYRVLPRVSDRDAFKAVIDKAMEPQLKTFGVVQARRFFRQRILDWIEPAPEDRLREIFRTVTARLSLVVITIDGENPYEIFESLNSTGLPLEESDLIRNYIFMQVPIDDQDEFHNQHWQKFESIFGEGENPRFAPTAFYRNYLMRNGAFSRAKMTFVDFKEQNRRRSIKPADQVAELRRFARLESMLRFPDECDDADIAKTLREIQLLEITTAHPLLLNLLDCWQEGSLAKDELLGCLQDLASFVIRRSICGASTRQYNRYFPEAVSYIEGSPRENLRRYWGKRGWPDDESFRQRLCDFPIYHRESKKARLILERLEAQEGHKEPVGMHGLTIEHVMPQRIDGTNGKTWRQTLGDDWFSLHAKWVHTLGNLTLTGYNPDLSNSPFTKKRELLAQSHVVLNKHFVDHETWGIDEIKARAGQMAEAVCQLWPVPADVSPMASTDATDEAQPRPMRRGKQRRLRYWKEFAQVLREREFPLVPLSIDASTYLSFDIGHPAVTMWTWTVPNRKELQVGLTFERRRGGALFAELRARQSELDKQLPASVEWSKGQPCWVVVKHPDASVADEDDWSRQHEWMAEKLSIMHEVLGPAIQQAGETIEPGTDRQTPGPWVDLVLGGPIGHLGVSVD